MILDVPYYSQFKDTKNPKWKNKSCGITALKMIMDYYRSDNPNIDELFQKGLDAGGFLENVGWYHHILANIAQSLGYQSVTRSWNVSKDAVIKLKGRGFSKEDLRILEQQQFQEALFTLKHELDLKHPSIISLPQGFKKGGTGHLVVLVGYDDEGFYFNDPDDQKRSGEKVKLTYPEFLKIFEKRAIFIQKI